MLNYFQNGYTNFIRVIVRVTIAKTSENILQSTCKAINVKHWWSSKIFQIAMIEMHALTVCFIQKTAIYIANFSLLL